MARYQGVKGKVMLLLAVVPFWRSMKQGSTLLYCDHGMLKHSK